MKPSPTPYLLLPSYLLPPPIFSLLPPTTYSSSLLPPPTSNLLPPTSCLPPPDPHRHPHDVVRCGGRGHPAYRNVRTHVPWRLLRYRTVATRGRLDGPAPMAKARCACWYSSRGGGAALHVARREGALVGAGGAQEASAEPRGCSWPPSRRPHRLSAQVWRHGALSKRARMRVVWGLGAAVCVYLGVRLGGRAGRERAAQPMCADGEKRGSRAARRVIHSAPLTRVTSHARGPWPALVAFASAVWRLGRDRPGTGVRLVVPLLLLGFLDSCVWAGHRIS